MEDGGFLEWVGLQLDPIVEGAPPAPGGGAVLHRLPVGREQVWAAARPDETRWWVDVDGDGWHDVLAGSPGVGSGRAFVYSGRDGSRIHALAGDAGGDRFGDAVAGMGDVTGDGLADLAVGVVVGFGVGGYPLALRGLLEHLQRD